MLQNRLAETSLLNDVMSRFNHVIGQGHDLNTVLERQITSTAEEWSDISDAVANQIKELDNAIGQLEVWHQAVQESDAGLTAVENQAAAQTSVGSDAESIKEQIEQVKVRMPSSNSITVLQ